MKQIDKLFAFPIIMIDGDEEDKKEKRGFTLGDDDEPDIIYGEAEVPFDTFISISDRWIPNTESRNRALDGKFDACQVMFETGPYLVPWNKSKFKKRLSEFAETIPEPQNPFLQVIDLEQLSKLKDDNNTGKGDKGYTEDEE